MPDELKKDENDPTPKEEINENDKVAYATYKRTVAQEKKLRAKLEDANKRLEEIERLEKQKEEELLKEQGEFKKLLDLERQKREELESENTSYKKSLLDAHKLNAFKEKLPAPVANPAYYDFVDLEGIVIDPETGLVNDDSVKSEVDKFVSTHSRLLDTKRTGLPNDAPNGSGGTLTVSEWKKLPLTERKKRMGEVYRATFG